MGLCDIKSSAQQMLQQGKEAAYGPGENIYWNFTQQRINIQNILGFQ